MVISGKLPLEIIIKKMNSSNQNNNNILNSYGNPNSSSKKDNLSLSAS